MIRFEQISKEYELGDNRVLALDNLSLNVKAGELIAVVGKSGSGKSTFLNLMGCLDIPTSGQYFLDGELVSNLDEDELASARNMKIGFIFQSFFLLPRLIAWENVAVPLTYRGASPVERKSAAMAMLKRVGLEDRATHKPNELSGGQRQRVAIARALVTNPELLLADEPTGNLDSATSNALLEMLLNLHKQGKTVIIVTHDDELATRCDRSIRLIDGRIAEDTGAR